MKPGMGLLLPWLLLIAAVSRAEAINIKEAEINNGAVVVQGNQAARNAAIKWEGVQVTSSNHGGVFKFSTSILPAACVGRLSDGVSTVEVVIAGCIPAPVVSAGVPQTGQTTTYASGDDGALRAGVTLPKPRFTDNGNGTVTDNLTRLIWLKDARCTNNGYTWQGALDFIAAINSGAQNCGDVSNGGTHQTDWRLPNLRELHSLVDYGSYNPALTKDFQAYPGIGLPFQNFQASYYWSSTTHTFNALNAWIVDFNFGFVGDGGTQAGRFVKTDTNNVIAVRGPQ